MHSAKHGFLTCAMPTFVSLLATGARRNEKMKCCLMSQMTTNRCPINHRRHSDGRLIIAMSTSSRQMTMFTFNRPGFFVVDSRLTIIRGTFSGSVGNSLRLRVCSLGESAKHGVLAEAEINDTAEDRWTGNVLSGAGINLNVDNRYVVVNALNPRNDLSGSEGPRMGNDVIAACEFEPEMMQAVHREWLPDHQVRSKAKYHDQTESEIKSRIEA